MVNHSISRASCLNSAQDLQYLHLQCYLHSLLYNEQFALAELPRPDRLKMLTEQAVARKKAELQVSSPFVPAHVQQTNSTQLSALLIYW